MAALSGSAIAWSRLARRPSAPLLLLLAFALILLRSPDILFAGRFWAEEATLYFHDARLGSWRDALLAPRMGYYSLWTRLAALAAAAVPLEVAPLVTAWAALLVQLAVLGIALRSDAFPPPLGPVLAALVVLFAAPSGEVWLNTINSQFHVALGAALLLVTSPGVIPAPLRLGFLALAAATGPVTAFLAPLFLWQALRQPSRLARAEAALVGLCAVVQAVLVAGGLAAGERAGAFDPAALLAALGIKLLVLPFLGDLANGAAGRLLGGSLAARIVVVAVMLVLAAAVAAVLIRQAAARLLALAGLGIAVLSYAGALLDDPWIAVPPLNVGRYAYVPNALVGLGLVVVATAPQAAPWRRAGAAGLLAALLAHGIAAYRGPAWALRGPDWRAEVAAWRADPGRSALAIWPAGWSLELSRR